MKASTRFVYISFLCAQLSDYVRMGKKKKTTKKKKNNASKARALRKDGMDMTDDRFENIIKDFNQKSISICFLEVLFCCLEPQ